MRPQFKHIVLYLSIGYLAAACSQSDSPALPKGDYITFGAPAISLSATQDDFAGRGGNTRATLLSTADLTEFNVYGFCLPNLTTGNGRDQEAAPNDWNMKNPFFRTGPDVFNNQKVAIENGFASYTISAKTNKVEWNSNPEARYTFLATYSPSGTFSMENASAETGKEHGPRITFTLPYSGGTASTSRDYKQQPDALIAAIFDHQRADGNVNFSFMHLMTGLRFKIHNHSSKELIITGMTFSGQFFRSTTFDFSSDSPTMTTLDETSNLYGATFTLLNNTQPLNLPAESALFIGGDEAPATLLLIPNPHATTDDTNEEFAIGRNKSIDIYYHFYDKNETDPEIIADNARARHFTTTSNFRLNYIPDANTLHTAHMNFTGNDFIIYFQADNATNWENGSDNNAVIK